MRAPPCSPHHLFQLLPIALVLAAPAAQAQVTPHHHRPAPTRPAPVAPLVVPPAAPPPAVIAPLDTAPPHPADIPPMPQIVAVSPGEASKIAQGVRLTFGPDLADLNQATYAALRILADTAPANPDLIFNVYAHATGGSADDNSTPRRLSLARALAVRAVLINAGVVSTRIYVHAMGTEDPQADAPPDRVDILIASLGSPIPAAPK